MVLEENTPKLDRTGLKQQLSRAEDAERRTGVCGRKRVAVRRCAAGVAELTGRSGASARKCLHFLDGSTLWALVLLVNQAAGTRRDHLLLLAARRLQGALSSCSNTQTQLPGRILQNKVHKKSEETDSNKDSGLLTISIIRAEYLTDDHDYTKIKNILNIIWLSGSCLQCCHKEEG